MAKKTVTCQHKSRLGMKVPLEPGSVAVSGFGKRGIMGPGNRMVIFLTAGSAPARWRILVETMHIREPDRLQVVLRGEDCCFSCAMRQACKVGDQVYLVL
jgi:hypothetical protein